MHNTAAPEQVADFALGGPGYAPPSEAEIFAMQILIFSSSGEFLRTCKHSLNAFGVENVSISNDISVLKSACEEDILDLLIFDTTDDEGQILSELATLTESRFSYLLRLEDENPVNEVLLQDERFAGILPNDTDSIAFSSLIRTTLRERMLSRKLLTVTRQAHSDILIDPLTGIANRRAFNFELSRKMIEWQRQRSPLALMMVDIDFFKRFNDQYGHQAGDRVLSETAQVIRSTLREMDLACRFGGEEFAVIQPLKHSNESSRSAERIRSAIESSVVSFEQLDLRVTVSIGVAEAMKGDDVDLLVKRADVALYASKQNGRNQVTLHDGAKCVTQPKAGEDVETEGSNSKQMCTGWAIQDDAFNLSASNLFVIDDSETVTDVVCAHLRQGGFQKLSYENDSTIALDRAESLSPELILLDIEMPGLDGLTLLTQFRSREQFKERPIIILTSHTDANTKSTALKLGATDVLHKPVSPNELIARVNNTLLAHAHSKFLKGYSKKLEHEVTLRTTDLLASRREAILCLARAAEINTVGASRHILRIGKYAALIASRIGFSESQIIEMEHAAQLHDIGKVEVPSDILTKPDNLTDEEFAVVKEHCFGGSRIIRDDGINQQQPGFQESLIDSCSSSMMRMAAIVAESHHEKWDGSGYPHGLKGLNIPIEGRIVAVCDVFDALSNPNSKRDGFQLDTCFDMILERKGTHFDPEIVDIFFNCKDEIIQIYNDFAS